MSKNIGIDLSQFKIEEFPFLPFPQWWRAGGQRRWAGSVGGWQRWATTLKPYFNFRFELGARKIIGLDTLKV